MLLGRHSREIYLVDGGVVVVLHRVQARNTSSVDGG